MKELFACDQDFVWHVPCQYILMRSQI